MHQLDLPALATRSSTLIQDAQKTAHPRYIRALLAFVEGCQSILQTFLHTPSETIRVLPMLTIFRAPYAFKALAMLKARMANPQDVINVLVDEQTLAWEFYSDGVSRVMEAASADGLYAYPTMALRIRKSIRTSKKADRENYEAQVAAHAASTTAMPQQVLYPELNMTDTVYDSQYELLNGSIMSFFPPQGDGSDAWPADFLDFGFLEAGSYGPPS
jgi:hypothetical protein